MSLKRMAVQSSLMLTAIIVVALLVLVVGNHPSSALPQADEAHPRVYPDGYPEWAPSAATPEQRHPGSLPASFASPPNEIERAVALEPVERLLPDFRVDNFITSSSKQVDITSRATVVVSGNLFVVWEDNREDHSNIYLQRYNASGEPQWSADLQVNTYYTPTAQHNPVIAYGVDGWGEGWLYVAWEDDRSGNSSNWDIYAQKISLDGEHGWDQDLRVNIDDSTDDQRNPSITYGDDGSGVGYVFFVWQDGTDTTSNVYMQKYLPIGTSPWTADQQVCGALGPQARPVVALDSPSHMLYVAWHDYREDNWEIFAQKMNALDGTRIWGNDGERITNLASTQSDPEIVLTNDGQYMYIAWESEQDLGITGWDIHADKLSLADSGPVSAWNGDKKVNVDSSNSDQINPTLTVDSNDNLYVAWQDHRGPDERIYAQKLDPTSSLPQWPNEGTPADQLLSADPVAGAGQYDPAIVLDKDNNYLFLVWEDHRNSTFFDDLYGQRCDLNAVMAWSVDHRMNTDTGAVHLTKTPTLALTDDDEFYVAWTDRRNGENYDVFVQAYTSAGERILAETDVRLATDEYVTDTNRFDPSLAIDLCIDTPNAECLYGVWQDNVISPDYDISSQKWPLDMSENGEWGAPNRDPAFNNSIVDHDSQAPILVKSVISPELVLYAVWLEDRAGDQDIYMQKRYANHARDENWPGDDLLVHVSDVDQNAPDAAVDAEGNVYVVWHDASAISGHNNIYARKITPDGSDGWGNVVQIDDGNSNSTHPAIAVDPNGDYFYVVWEDDRNGTANNMTNIYAQKLRLDNGSRVWSSQDVPATRDTSASHFAPDVAVGDNRYVYLVWEDWRNGNADVYAQLLNPHGLWVWDTDYHIDGSADQTDQMNPRIVMLNNEESFFVAWVDRRGGNRHIYATKWGHRSSVLDHFTCDPVSDPIKSRPFPITIRAIDTQDLPIAITADVSLQDSTGTIFPTVAQFTNASSTTLEVQISQAARDVIITAIYEDITGTCGPFDVIELDHFTFNTISDQEASVPFPITVHAIDNRDLPVAITGDVLLSDSTDTISPTAVSFANESSKQVDVFISVADTGVVITATFGTATGVSNDFDVLPPPALDRFTIDDVANQGAGRPFPITVHVFDDEDAPMAITGDVALSDSTGTISPNAVSFAHEVSKTIDVTIASAAPDVVITATYGTVTGTSNVFDVTAYVYLPVVRKDDPYKEREPNDTCGLANRLGWSDEDYWGYHHFEEPDGHDDDYFYLDTSVAGTITADLTTPVSDLQLLLYYEGGCERNDDVARVWESPYHLEYNGAPGRYYIRIYSVYSSTIPYTLTTSFP